MPVLGLGWWILSSRWLVSRGRWRSVRRRPEAVPLLDGGGELLGSGVAERRPTLGVPDLDSSKGPGHDDIAVEPAECTKVGQQANPTLGVGCHLIGLTGEVA